MDLLRLLEEEHADLRLRLELLEDASRSGSPGATRLALELCWNFLRHEQIEEKQLFVELSKLPGPPTKAADVCKDHARVHQAISDLREAFETDAPDRPSILRTCAGLLRDHLDREEDTVFPAARVALGEARLAELGDEAVSLLDLPPHAGV